MDTIILSIVAVAGILGIIYLSYIFIKTIIKDRREMGEVGFRVYLLNFIILIILAGLIKALTELF